MKQLILGALGLSLIILSTVDVKGNDGQTGGGPADMQGCIVLYYSVLYDGQPNAEYRAVLHWEACLVAAGLNQLPPPEAP